MNRYNRNMNMNMNFGVLLRNNNNNTNNIDLIVNIALMVRPIAMHAMHLCRNFERRRYRCGSLATSHFACAWIYLERTFRLTATSMAQRRRSAWICQKQTYLFQKWFRHNEPNKYLSNDASNLWSGVLWILWLISWPWKTLMMFSAKSNSE